VVEADRDLGPQVGQPLPGVLEPASQAAGDARQEDVVDGHVTRQRAADRLQVGEREGREGELAGAADPAVEDRVGAAVAELAGDRAGHPGELSQTPVGRGGGQPRHVRLGRRLRGFVPEHLAQEAHRADPIRHRVMDPADDRLPPVVERADQVELPQRPAMVEPLRHQPRGDPPRPALGDSLGLRLVPHVGGDLEVPVEDPPGLVAELDPVAAAGARRKARLDAGPQRLDVKRIALRQHDQLQRVSGDRLGLERQDAGVVDAQAIALRLGHRRTVAAWVASAAASSRGARAGRRATRIRRPHRPRAARPR
jgi:hypothetical protein